MHTMRAVAHDTIHVIERRHSLRVLISSLNPRVFLDAGVASSRALATRAMSPVLDALSFNGSGRPTPADM
jgi:hypothetical protein